MINDSKREPFLILSISTGLRFGLVFTAWASIFIIREPTTIGSKGRLRFRLQPLTFFRSDTMHGGGFKAKLSSKATWSGKASALNLRGMAFALWGPGVAELKA